MRFSSIQEIELILKVKKQSDSGLFSNERLLAIKSGYISYYSQIPKSFVGNTRSIQLAGQFPKFTLSASDITSIKYECPYLTMNFLKKKLINKGNFQKMIKNNFPSDKKDKNNKQSIDTWKFKCKQIDLVNAFVQQVKSCMKPELNQDNFNQLNYDSSRLSNLNGTRNYRKSLQPRLELVISSFKAAHQDKQLQQYKLKQQNNPLVSAINIGSKQSQLITKEGQKKEIINQRVIKQQTSQVSKQHLMNEINEVSKQHLMKEINETKKSVSKIQQKLNVIIQRLDIRELQDKKKHTIQNQQNQQKFYDQIQMKDISKKTQKVQLINNKKQATKKRLSMIANIIEEKVQATIINTQVEDKEANILSIVNQQPRYYKNSINTQSIYNDLHQQQNIKSKTQDQLGQNIIILQQSIEANAKTQQLDIKLNDVENEQKNSENIPMLQLLHQISNDMSNISKSIQKTQRDISLMNSNLPLLDLLNHIQTNYQYPQVKANQQHRQIKKNQLDRQKSLHQQIENIQNEIQNKSAQQTVKQVPKQRLQNDTQKKQTQIVTYRPIKNQLTQSQELISKSQQIIKQQKFLTKQQVFLTKQQVFQTKQQSIVRNQQLESKQQPVKQVSKNIINDQSKIQEQNVNIKLFDQSILRQVILQKNQKLIKTNNLSFDTQQTIQQRNIQNVQLTQKPKFSINQVKNFKNQETKEQPLIAENKKVQKFSKQFIHLQKQQNKINEYTPFIKKNIKKAGKIKQKMNNKQIVKSQIEKVSKFLIKKSQTQQKILQKSNQKAIQLEIPQQQRKQLQEVKQIINLQKEPQTKQNNNIQPQRNKILRIHETQNKVTNKILTNQNPNKQLANHQKERFNKNQQIKNLQIKNKSLIKLVQSIQLGNKNLYKNQIKNQQDVKQSKISYFKKKVQISSQNLIQKQLFNKNTKKASNKSVHIQKKCKSFQSQSSIKDSKLQKSKISIINNILYQQEDENQVNLSQNPKQFMIKQHKLVQLSHYQQLKSNIVTSLFNQEQQFEYWQFSQARIYKSGKQIQTDRQFQNLPQVYSQTIHPYPNWLNLPIFQALINNSPIVSQTLTLHSYKILNLIKYYITKEQIPNKIKLQIQKYHFNKRIRNQIVQVFIKNLQVNGNVIQAVKYIIVGKKHIQMLDNDRFQHDVQQTSNKSQSINNKYYSMYQQFNDISQTYVMYTERAFFQDLSVNDVMDTNSLQQLYPYLNNNLSNISMSSQKISIDQRSKTTHSYLNPQEIQSKLLLQYKLLQKLSNLIKICTHKINKLNSVLQNVIIIKALYLRYKNYQGFVIKKFQDQQQFTNIKEQLVKQFYNHFQQKSILNKQLLNLLIDKHQTLKIIFFSTKNQFHLQPNKITISIRQKQINELRQNFISSKDEKSLYSRIQSFQTSKTSIIEQSNISFINIKNIPSIYQYNNLTQLYNKCVKKLSKYNNGRKLNIEKIKIIIRKLMQDNPKSSFLLVQYIVQKMLGFNVYQNPDINTQTPKLIEAQFYVRVTMIQQNYQYLDKSQTKIKQYINKNDILQAKIYLNCLFIKISRQNYALVNEQKSIFYIALKVLQLLIIQKKNVQAESLAKQILELLPSNDIVRLKFYYLLLAVYSQNECKTSEFVAVYQSAKGLIKSLCFENSLYTLAFDKFWIERMLSLKKQQLSGRKQQYIVIETKFMQYFKTISLAKSLPILIKCKLYLQIYQDFIEFLLVTNKQQTAHKVVDNAIVIVQDYQLGVEMFKFKIFQLKVFIQLLTFNIISQNDVVRLFAQAVQKSNLRYATICLDCVLKLWQVKHLSNDTLVQVLEIITFEDKLFIDTKQAVNQKIRNFISDQLSEQQFKHILKNHPQIKHYFIK